MNQEQLYGAAVLVVAVLAAVLLVRMIRARRRLRAHQDACRTPGYEPLHTFTGTLRHLEGLPVPRGRKLGTAANTGWGIAFAKGRFRYAVPAQEILAVRVLRPQERPGRRFPWPQRLLEIELAERGPLLFSLPWPGRFAERLLEAFCPSRSAAGGGRFRSSDCV